MIGRYWAAGTAPVFEIIAGYGRSTRRPVASSGPTPGSRVTITVIDGASHALFPKQPDAVASAVIGYRRTLT